MFWNTNHQITFENYFFLYIQLLKSVVMYASTVVF